MNIALLLLFNLGILAASAALLWIISIKLKDVSFVDSWWPLGMVAAAAVSFSRSPGGAHADWLLGLCTLWGLRLGGYMLWRWRTQGSDPRYTAMLDDARTRRGWSFAKSSLLLVFLLQPPLQFLVCLPVQLGPMAPASNLHGMAWSGAILGLFGVAFESIADWQLARFRSNPANRGKVMDCGLWRYSRHPNYFGEACLWWGLYFIAAETGVGAWSILGPILITVLLTKGSGVPTVEGRMKGRRPGYEAYVRRTSGFIPWFPKGKAA